MGVGLNVPGPCSHTFFEPVTSFGLPCTDSAGKVRELPLCACALPAAGALAVPRLVVCRVVLCSWLVFLSQLCPTQPINVQFVVELTTYGETTADTTGARVTPRAPRTPTGAAVQSSRPAVPVVREPVRARVAAGPRECD
jgi:hypothetical protein